MLKNTNTAYKWTPALHLVLFKGPEVTLFLYLQYHLTRGLDLLLSYKWRERKAQPEEWFSI